MIRAQNTNVGILLSFTHFPKLSVVT